MKIHNWTPQEYHRDPLGPSLSAHTAVDVLNSPAVAHEFSPRLGGNTRPSSASKDSGSGRHSLLLRDGVDIVRIDAADFRTKAAQQARDEAYAQGKVPIIADKYDEMENWARIVKDKLRNRWGVTLNGQSEVAVTWNEKSTDGLKVLCRGMFDHLWPNVGIADFKTTEKEIKPHTVAGDMRSYGADIQWAAYISASHLPMVFYFIENNAPYQVAKVELSELGKEVARRKWKRAVDIWSTCLSTGHWPQVNNDQPIIVEPTMWELRQYEVSVYETPEIMGDFESEGDWNANDYF